MIAFPRKLISTIRYIITATVSRMQYANLNGKFSR